MPIEMVWKCTCNIKINSRKSYLSFTSFKELGEGGRPVKTWNEAARKDTLHCGLIENMTLNVELAANSRPS